jgi:protein-tyrosine kinase
MSRIEEALQKLRSQSPRPAVATTRLAAVVPHDHAYAGHRIVVDRAQLRANGLLAPDAEERQLAEQYRTIKRPLLRNADAELDPPLVRANLIMVASALSGEGKTFTCVNLCLSIARERDWSVVLVDADCSKPHLTRLFAAENEPGLIDLLRDPGLSFEQLVMPTDVPGLSLLPAGSHDPHASELLASKRMDELCNVLSTDGAGRIIVFDSSPLLLTTEAPVLASKVGQVIVVVRANDTPRQAVLAALAKLDQAKAIGCVFNRTTVAEHAENYGYYGSDHGPGSDAAAASQSS